MPCDFPSGSVERAKLLSLRILSAWELASTTEQAWEMEVDKAREEAAHALLGFPDFDAYLDALTGKSERERVERFRVDPDACEKRGGDRRSEAAQSMCTVHNDSQQHRAEENGVSRRTQVWLDRLARDRPDLLEEVQAGRLRTKTAARQAGIVRVPSNYELAQKIIRKLTDEERGALVNWMDEGMPL